MKLRARILIPFTAAMLLFTLIVVVAVRHASDVLIRNSLEQTVEHEHLALDEATAAVTEHLEGFIYPITVSQDFIAAMQHQDRDRLLALAKPYLDTWRKLNGVTHFYFHTTDGYNLLRVHLPERYGDLIKRRSLRLAMESGKVGVATETGLTGEWVRRVVVPWKVQGELIGYIELGVDMEHIYSSGSVHLSTVSMVLLEKHHIQSPEIWLKRRAELGYRLFDWDALPDHVVASYTGESLDFGFLKSVPLDQSQDGHSFKIGDRNLIAHIHPLMNEEIGQVIGAELLLTDTSAIEQLSAADITLTISSALALLVLVIVLLYRYLGKLQDRIETEESRMQALVDEKTQQLRGYQTQLEEKIWDRTADLIRAQGVAHIGSWKLDIPNNQLAWSDETYRIFGVPNDGTSLTLEKFVGCLHSDDRDRVLAAWNAAMAGADYDIEHRILRGSEVCWVRERAELEWGADGMPMAAVGTVQDITSAMLIRLQLEASEAALRYSEKRLSDIVNASADWIWEVDAQGRYIYVSEGVTQLLGYTPDEVLGKTPFDFMPPEEAHRLGEIFGAIAAEKRQFRDLQNINIHKDGSLHHTWTNGVPVLNERGELLGYRGLDRDVTDHIAAQEELSRHRHHLEELVAQRTEELSAAKESAYSLNRMLHTVLDTIPVRIFWKDTNLNYLGCNHLFALDAGKHTPAEVVGRDDFSMSWHETAELYRTDDRHVIETGEGKLNFEEPQTHENSNTTWLRTTKIPLRNDSGHVFGVLGMYEDITQEKEIQQALLESRDAAETANKAKSTFLANMSHEIRTPLNGILGIAQIGQRESLDARSRHLFDQVLDSGQLLLGIISDVLDFSKIEAGKLEIETSDVQLDHLIRHVTIMCCDHASTKGLPLRIQTDAAVPKWFKGDSLRIAQVLGNLLSNATKFTEKGEVGLDISRDNGHLLFRVRDTGIGMSETQVAKLFAPFEQADLSITRRFGGTGLGLAISKRLVELMHGEISVESAAGVGSVFTVRLPLIESDPAVEAKLPSQQPKSGQHSLAGRRILAAEDNPVNRMVLEDMLTLSGASLVCVEHGQQALDVIARDGEAAFDIVLTDIHMPVMDGHALAQRLREIAPNLPVVGVTAHAMLEEKQKCLESGMVAHVAKPIEMDELIDVVLTHSRRKLPPPASEAIGPKHDAPSGVAVAGDTGILDQYIEWSALQAQYQGRQAFINKLLGMLVQSHSETPAKLRSAVAVGDLATLAFVAHSFAGVAGALHADKLRAMGKAVELQAKSGDMNAVAEAATLAVMIEQFVGAIGMHLYKQIEGQKE